MPDDKVFNAREAARELGYIKKYIIERKRWLEGRKREAKNQTNANKKAFDKRQKDIADKTKQEEKDRLAEVARLKRQKSIAEVNRLLSTTAVPPTEPEPRPGPSTEFVEAVVEEPHVEPDETHDSSAKAMHEAADEPVETHEVVEEEEEESEPEIVSPVTSKSRSQPMADTPGLADPSRPRRKTRLTDETGAMQRLGAILNSLKSLHKKQDAMDDWLSRRDEVWTFCNRWCRRC